jgi:hypothetical protein
MDSDSTDGARLIEFDGDSPDDPGEQPNESDPSGPDPLPLLPDEPAPDGPRDNHVDPGIFNTEYPDGDHQAGDEEEQ